MAQDWISCRYSVGNLEIDPKKDILLASLEERLLRKIFLTSESEDERFFRENGMNLDYFCENPEMVKMAMETDTYRVSRKPKGKFPGRILLYNVWAPAYCEEYQISPKDMIESYRPTVESDIKHGLRMCTHCGFYHQRASKD